MIFTYFSNAAEEKAFEQAKNDFVSLLERKRTYYESNANKSTHKAIQAQNIELRTLTHFHNCALKFIEAQGEALRMADKEVNKKTEEKNCLEAVCLLHGINNFPLFAARGFNVLLEDVKETYRENRVFVPERLKKIF